MLALARHYRIVWLQMSSLMTEYLRGLVSFVRWIPRLITKVHVLRSPHPQAQGNPGQSFSSASELDGFFINLESRQDRLRHIRATLQSAGLERLQRFPAVAESIGILGCTRSHIAVLERAQEAGYPLTLICEDDLEFLRGQSELEAVVKEFVQHPGLDVLCLAYRLRAPNWRVSPELSVANSIQTASCYVVKAHAVETLLQSFRESETMLENGVSPQIAANDMHWKKYQTSTLFFAIPRKRVGRQRPSFSNIANRFKDYRA